MAYLMNMAAFDRGVALMADMQAQERQAKKDERQATLDARTDADYEESQGNKRKTKEITESALESMRQPTVDDPSMSSFFGSSPQANAGPMAHGSQIDSDPANPTVNNVVANQPAVPKFSLTPEQTKRRSALLNAAELAAINSPQNLPVIQEQLAKFDMGAKASNVHHLVMNMPQEQFASMVKRANDDGDFSAQVELKADGAKLTMGDRKIDLSRRQVADWLTGKYLMQSGDLEGGRKVIASIDKDLADRTTKHNDMMAKVTTSNQTQFKDETDRGYKQGMLDMYRTGARGGSAGASSASTKMDEEQKLEIMAARNAVREAEKRVFESLKGDGQTDPMKSPQYVYAANQLSAAKRQAMAADVKYADPSELASRVLFDAKSTKEAMQSLQQLAAVGGTGIADQVGGLIQGMPEWKALVEREKPQPAAANAPPANSTQGGADPRKPSAGAPRAITQQGVDMQLLKQLYGAKPQMAPTEDSKNLQILQTMGALQNRAPSSADVNAIRQRMQEQFKQPR